MAWSRVLHNGLDHVDTARWRLLQYLGDRARFGPIKCIWRRSRSEGFSPPGRFRATEVTVTATCLQRWGGPRAAFLLSRLDPGKDEARIPVTRYRRRDVASALSRESTTVSGRLRSGWSGPTAS